MFSRQQFFFLPLVIPKTKKGLDDITDAWDLEAELKIQTRYHYAKTCLDKKTLFIPDNDYVTVERNIQEIKDFLIASYYFGCFGKYFGFTLEDFPFLPKQREIDALIEKLEFKAKG